VRSRTVVARRALCARRPAGPRRPLPGIMRGVEAGQDERDRPDHDVTVAGRVASRPRPRQARVTLACWYERVGCRRLTEVSQR
jgi:hypothetical protein